jgi:hypothetical protein
VLLYNFLFSPSAASCSCTIDSKVFEVTPFRLEPRHGAISRTAVNKLFAGPAWDTTTLLNPVAKELTPSMTALAIEKPSD